MKYRRNSVFLAALLVGWLFVPLTSMSQSAGRAAARGTVVIAGDTRVSLLVEKHIEMNERVRTIPGFRIQVASLSGADSKRRAFELKERLREAYPGIEVYVVFDEPNFKVKVGDFRTRLQAFAFLTQIKNVFPGTIVKDNVYAIPLEAPPVLDLGDDDF